MAAQRRYPEIKRVTKPHWPLLGVRMPPELGARIDAYRRDHDYYTASDAVRSLIHTALEMDQRGKEGA